MKKLSLLTFTYFMCIFGLFSQNAVSKSSEDQNSYQKPTLTVEEASILSSYYSQTGSHSATQGGEGSESLQDFCNNIEIKLLHKTKKKHSNQIKLGFGIDYYTSASSDQIDYIPSSASISDVRVYPSIDYTHTPESQNYSIGGGLSMSREFDYLSMGGNFHYSKSLNDGNTEITTRLSVYLDQLDVIRPFELRTSGSRYVYPSETRNTYSMLLGINQILSQRTQGAIIIEPAIQQGFLSTPFHRVYLASSTEAVAEALPRDRWKLPISLRLNHSVNDWLIIRSYYRFFTDQWGINAHTLQLETPLILSESMTLIPSVRVGSQTASKYFGAIRTITTDAQYRTSDYDLSEFRSIMPQMTLRLQPKGGLILPSLNSIELSGGYYHRTNDLDAFIVSALIRFKY